MLQPRRYDSKIFTERMPSNYHSTKWPWLEKTMYVHSTSSWYIRHRLSNPTGSTSKHDLQFNQIQFKSMYSSLNFKFKLNNFIFLNAMYFSLLVLLVLLTVQRCTVQILLQQEVYVRLIMASWKYNLDQTEDHFYQM